MGVGCIPAEEGHKLRTGAWRAWVGERVTAQWHQVRLKRTGAMQRHARVWVWSRKRRKPAWGFRCRSTYLKLNHGCPVEPGPERGQRDCGRPVTGWQTRQGRRTEGHGEQLGDSGNIYLRGRNLHTRGRGERQIVQPLWKTEWRFLEKLDLERPCDPTIPLPDINPEELKAGS